MSDREVCKAIKEKVAELKAIDDSVDLSDLLTEEGGYTFFNDEPEVILEVLTDLLEELQDAVKSGRSMSNEYVISVRSHTDEVVISKNSKGKSIWEVAFTAVKDDNGEMVTMYYNGMPLSKDIMVESMTHLNTNEDKIKDLLKQDNCIRIAY